MDTYSIDVVVHSIGEHNNNFANDDLWIITVSNYFNTRTNRLIKSIVELIFAGGERFFYKYIILYIEEHNKVE